MSREPQIAPLPGSMRKFALLALLVGVAGAALCVIGYRVNPPRFLLSYLYAYVFWIGIPLGSLALLMLQHLTGGAWGLVIRRHLEAATRLLPLMLVLFVPVVLGMKHLYPWVDHPPVSESSFRVWWLQPGQFMLRAGIYFAVWMLLALLLNAWSSAEDRAEPHPSRRFQLLSGPGLVIYGLTVTFAAVDWVMTLDVHWYSTIFGMIFMIGQALAALALGIVVTAWLRQTRPIAQVVSSGKFHDLGNLLLAFTMIWAYLSFSQFLIMWSGNLAEETPFYGYRIAGGWQWLALVLIVLHFFVPFFILLSRRNKRAVGTLTAVAGWILLMRLVDLMWLIVPFYAQARPAEFPLAHWHLSFAWTDVAAVIGMGGIWMALFVWQLGRKPLLPLHDARLKEVSVAHA